MSTEVKVGEQLLLQDGQTERTLNIVPKQDFVKIEEDIMDGGFSQNKEDKKQMYENMRKLTTMCCYTKRGSTNGIMYAKTSMDESQTHIEMTEENEKKCRFKVCFMEMTS
jgi:hypothetical protein